MADLVRYERQRQDLPTGRPLSSSGLFGDAVNSVVDRFQEASKQAAAFRRFLPRRSRAQGAAGQQPSTSTGSSYREAQKESAASRAPPRRSQKQRYSSGTSRSKPDLRSVLTARRSQKKKS